MIKMIETRIDQNLRTMIPTKYVKKYNLEENDIVEWKVNENEEIIISFKKSKIFHDK